MSIEFFLVIIGILIALAIDDWQTDRNNSLREHDYYCQLLNDFELDIDKLEQKRVEANFQIESGKQYIRDLNSFQHDKDSLLALFMKSVRSYPYVPINATYKDLSTSGDLKLLKNHDLKKKIITYYTDLDSIVRVMDVNRNFRLSRLLDGWDNLLELGWQNPSVTPGLNLDTEFLNLLPNVEWHLDKDNPYFKQTTEVVFISMTIAAREMEWIDVIMKNIHPMQLELTQQCFHKSLI